MQEQSYIVIMVNSHPEVKHCMTREGLISFAMTSYKYLDSYKHVECRHFFSYHTIIVLAMATPDLNVVSCFMDR